MYFPPKLPLLHQFLNTYPIYLIKTNRCVLSYTVPPSWLSFGQYSYELAYVLHYCSKVLVRFFFIIIIKVIVNMLQMISISDKCCFLTYLSTKPEKKIVLISKILI